MHIATSLKAPQILASKKAIVTQSEGAELAEGASAPGCVGF